MSQVAPTEEVLHDGPRSNPIALIVLLAGGVLLARVAGVNAPLVILGIAVMIFFHELGHFITAKWTGMKATEFFLGFGPKLWSFKKGDTEYGLKLIPAGAYVKIIGMHNLEEVDPADEPNTFRQKSYPRRVLVASAGSLMHFVMATLLFVIAYSFVGVEDRTKWYVGDTVPIGAAAKAGIQPGDRILSVNGTQISAWDDLGPAVADLYDQPVQFTVRRNGQVLQLDSVAGWRLSQSGADGIDGLLKGEQVLAVEGQPVTSYADFLTKVEEGHTYNVRVYGVQHSEYVEFDTKVLINKLDPAGGAVGYLGVSFGAPNEPLGIVDGTRRGLSEIGYTSKAAVLGVKSFFSSKGLHDTFSNAFSKSSSGSSDTPNGVVTDKAREAENDRDNNRAISIIGAARATKQVADKQGVGGALKVFAALNIFIGILNLLPLLPLDGGHIVVATYERLRSRRDRMYHADFAKLLPVTYVVVLLMVTLFLFTGLRDIIDPVKV